MSSPRHSTSLTSDDRQIALERLAAAARAIQAAGADLEQRMAQVRAATTVAELDEVLADVPTVGGAMLADSAAKPMVQPPPLEEARLAVLFRHAERNGRWTMPRVLRLAAVCGHVELDLSDAVFLPGTSRIVLRTWLSHVEITVPAWIRLEGDGTVSFTRRDDGTPVSAVAPLAVVTVTGEARATQIEVLPAAARIPPSQTARRALAT